jgi:hypothetical protein
MVRKSVGEVVVVDGDKSVSADNLLSEDIAFLKGLGKQGEDYTLERDGESVHYRVYVEEKNPKVPGQTRLNLG